MLDSPSQLLLRHDVVQDDTWLVNAQDSLGQQHQLNSHFFYADTYYKYGRAEDTFGPSLSCDGPCVGSNEALREDSRQRPYPGSGAGRRVEPLDDASNHRSVVIYVPKEKPLFWMIMANLAACLEAGTRLYLVGSNKGGIKSLIKHLPPQWQSARKVASGNHCLLFETERSAVAAQPFTLRDYTTKYPVALSDPAADVLTVTNLPGVFSDQRVDVGTAVLLEYLLGLKRSKNGLRVLDFACGNGVIGAFLRQHFAVSELVACDISAMALYCSEQTLAAQGLPSKYQVVASDGLNNVSGHFDWIVSNPPFHAGQKTDYRIAEQFFADAAKQLTRSGRLTVVANSFLGYNELLERHFRNVNEVLNTRKYKIIEAAHPF